jgi:hypothetical protein
MEVRNMSSLESMVCPWVGCGGTIHRRLGDAYGGGWVCDMCGEFFTSPEDYKAKLHKENEWAEAWIRQADEKKKGLVAGTEQVERLSVDEGLEEILVGGEMEETGSEEEIEKISVAP